ncbi:MAG: aminopeptidase [Betaproteobacteria bacterium]|nr:aminopeptidase [Betaproteobacteria bacterium]NBX95652.1 aminopeptidase [Betaproteobacteria bacterium]
MDASSRRPSLFGPVARFEWAYQLRSPVLWVGFALFFLLTFGATTVDQIQIGSRGNVNINAPYAILQTMGILSLFAMFVVVALVAGTVVRDDETGFAPILRSTRLTKWAYLSGRFCGAIAAALFVLASVPLAIAVGSAMPWLDAERLGPFVPLHYLWALFVMGLPTMLILGAMSFSLATVTRSMMWSYVGAVALLVAYLVTRGLLRDPQFDQITALTDPFGLSALAITTKYWTAAERNTLLPELSGVFLANRLLWVALGAAVFAVAATLFRFEQRGATARAGQGSTPAAGSALATAPSPARPATARALARLGAMPQPRTDRATRWAQFSALARFDMAFVMRSPAFFVLLFIGVLNAGGNAWFTNEWYGSPSYPVTRLMVQALQGAFNLMSIIIAIYYAGELVWRDRERRIHEIVDATAAPGWAHLVPKIGAIALVLIATGLVAVLTGMAVQLAKGWTQLEPMSYMLWYLWPTVVVALQLAVLSVMVQVLVPQKFIGWGVMLVYIVASIALGTAGFEHNLYNYAGAPGVPLSDMSGMSRFWVGQAWFHLYWSAFAVLLAVLAHAFWRRGNGGTLRQRWPQARARLRGGAGALAVGSGLAFAGLGGFIFWNTNVLNRYITAPELEEQTAAAEKALLPFEQVPQPRITAVTLDVDLYPRQARAVTHGTYVVENRSGVPVTELHVSTPPNLKLERLVFPGAALKTEHLDWGYRIYTLAQAMPPGERRELAFTTVLHQKGFANSAALTRIVDNGTFLNNGEITPMLGVNRGAFLQDRAKRRKHGLPPELRPPTLEDASGRQRQDLRHDSDWVTADITVTTDADQTPVAPGYTVSDTVKDGRRTVRFKPDAPLMHFFSIQSARYAVAKDKLGEIELAVYHHPGHQANVRRMLEAMKVSLELFSQAFSPYQFRQARILEFPSYADFAQSFANTIPYSENIGFLTQLADPDKIDVVTYITAHEIAHQWWGHQVVSSSQQGGTFIIESLSQYSALLVMEKLYGPEHMRRFLKYELDRYLRSRGGEVLEELPLARVENQPYIHYQKGALALWWLKEVVGTPVLNRALASFVKEFSFKPAPYPNSLDLLRHIRREAGTQHDALITDLFEKITLVDVKAKDPKVQQRPDGRWEVSFQVEARKLYADGKGVETDAPLDEEFDVGAFTAEPGKKGYSARDVLMMQRQRIRTGTQTVRLTSDRRPTHVGVDPYNKRIDRNSDDNVVAISAQD